ncbi:hypothetical protein ACPCSK_34665 [Streptomyces griseoincarnatus]
MVLRAAGTYGRRLGCTRDLEALDGPVPAPGISMPQISHDGLSTAA